MSTITESSNGISEVGYSMQRGSKCQGPGQWNAVALLFCSHMPAMPYCLSYTAAIGQLSFSTLPQANLPKAFVDIKF